MTNDKHGYLYVCFWDICLENIPVGRFARHLLRPEYAKLCIEDAKRDGKLLCLSEKDLLAPYHEDSLKKHTELCAALKTAFDITLSPNDFFHTYDDDDDPMYVVNPLIGMRLQPQDCLIIVTCAYTLAPERKKCDLLFDLAPDTIEFHLIEPGKGDEAEESAVASAQPTPIPITQDELIANFDATIDKVVAGAVFEIITEGKPSVFMVPYRQFAYLDSKSEIRRQSELASSHPGEDAALKFISDAADTGDGE